MGEGKSGGLGIVIAIVIVIGLLVLAGATFASLRVQSVRSAEVHAEAARAEATASRAEELDLERARSSRPVSPEPGLAPFLGFQVEVEREGGRIIVLHHRDWMLVDGENVTVGLNLARPEVSADGLQVKRGEGNVLELPAEHDGLRVVGAGIYEEAAGTIDWTAMIRSGASIREAVRAASPVLAERLATVLGPR